jgi:DnaK suppressor protein
VNIKKLTKKEKQDYRRMLMEKKETIIRKLSNFISESKEVEINIAQDVVDKAESSYTKEFLLSLSDTERDQLMLIDEALRRIDTDGFGSCQLCGLEINRKRLEAIPWTSYCISCQEKAEEESKSH